MTFNTKQESKEHSIIIMKRWKLTVGESRMCIYTPGLITTKFEIKVVSRSKHYRTFVPIYYNLICKNTGFIYYLFCIFWNGYSVLKYKTMLKHDNYEINFF